MRNAAGAPQGGAVFKPVRLGGGGFVTGISISANAATKVIRTDVFNGYVKGASDTVWRPLFTSATLPVGEYPNSAGYVAPAGGLLGNSPFGCYEAVVSPSDATRIYAVCNTRLYRSENTGISWTKCGLSDTQLYSNNGGNRLWGKRIAVDNQNADVFLLGTMVNGLYYSTDKGATMTAVTIPAGDGSPYLVACDPISTITSSIRQRWFAVVQGTGIYVSTTGPGGTYTLMAGSPTTACDMKFDVNGNCWVVTVSGAKNLWSCAAGGTTWVQSTTISGTYSTVAVNPANANHIVCMTVDSFAAVSVDGGTTWLAGGTYFLSFPNPGTINEYGFSVPWLNFGKAVKHFPSTIEFDPVTAGKLWSPEGLGVRWCNAPTTANNDSTGRFDWTEDTAGNEELVAKYMLSIPGSAVLLLAGDKPIWRITNPDIFTREGPFCPGGNSQTVIHGYGAAYAADNPLYVAALINFGGGNHGYSTNGGSSWQLFPTSPPNNGIGGCIAVGNQNNVILVYSSNAQPVYTKNGGVSWATLPFPNLPATGAENGFGFAWYVNRHIITYDAGAGAFYLYNYGRTAAPTEAGLYKSVDQGDSWTKIFSGHLTNGGNSDGWWVKFRAVPDNTGHFFWAVGQDFPTDTFKRSTDGGVTWTSVANVTGVVDFGFGKAAPGKSYPAIYLYGAVSSVVGVWRSDDNCATWVKLSNAWPNNSLDSLTVCGGDLNIYGRCYLGYAGSGFAYGDYDDKVTLA